VIHYMLPSWAIVHHQLLVTWWSSLVHTPQTRFKSMFRDSRVRNDLSYLLLILRSLLLISFLIWGMKSWLKDGSRWWVHIGVISKGHLLIPGCTNTFNQRFSFHAVEERRRASCCARLQ
jgi:hypothetical protein